ncbi:trimeric intracellular cation channel family protein [Prosthecobacter sp. SYSU 5D2]|uniref:trimeric intracellular cation channel family protein n=1 Tax=Prosthecobacter sp. SYSU 5D2 TaxID=3134134 RepID=UPI0031FE6375
MPPWIEFSACAVCAISGVLAAEGKRMDLFGALVLALVTAVGGGTLRDLCLDLPVFWIQVPDFVTVSLVAAVGTFILARFLDMPARALAVADAFGLALFAIIGTEKALMVGSPGLVAVLMGIITGVAGGILRDVLRGEIPVVLRAEIELYATAAGLGATAYVLSVHWLPASPSHRYIGMAIILFLRLAAMYWSVKLPIFITRPRP